MDTGGEPGRAGTRGRGWPISLPFNVKMGSISGSEGPRPDGMNPGNRKVTPQVCAREGGGVHLSLFLFKPTSSCEEEMFQRRLIPHTSEARSDELSCPSLLPLFTSHGLM